MRCALAWVLYWLGDMVERWNDNDRRFTSAGFHLYQWLMSRSDIVQGSSPHGPWQPASGILTEGGDAKQAPGDSLSSPTGKAGDAQGVSHE